ncbi:MAG TPA: hypothetical protein VGG43_08410 [Acidimicrobiales bacterium]|jgi:hypothetical protein
MTTAISGNNQWPETMRRTRSANPAGELGANQATRSLSASLWSLGVITLLISAWGGIIPYLGPTFSFSADGANSWQWNLTHSVLALVPGAIGCLVAFTFLAPLSAEGVARRRVSLTVAGLVAVVCGAWFVIGPLAWPIVDNTGQYFVAADPLRLLSNQVGYSFGPGLILAACGAFAIGWAVRHNRPLEAVGANQPVDVEESVSIVRTEPAAPRLTAPPAATPADYAAPSAESAAPAQAAAPPAPTVPASSSASMASETMPSAPPMASAPPMKPVQSGIPGADPAKDG